jgi:hypothetical protein
VGFDRVVLIIADEDIASVSIDIHIMFHSVNGDALNGGRYSSHMLLTAPQSLIYHFYDGGIGTILRRSFSIVLLVSSRANPTACSGELRAIGSPCLPYEIKDRFRCRHYDSNEEC